MRHVVGPDPNVIGRVSGGHPSTPARAAVAPIARHLRRPARRRHINPRQVNKFIALTIVLLASGSLHASGSERFITKVKLPSGQTAVVEEGEFEARSLGSFSVRLYDAAPTGDETTFFLAGQVRARDGSV